MADETLRERAEQWLNGRHSPGDAVALVRDLLAELQADSQRADAAEARLTALQAQHQTLRQALRDLCSDWETRALVSASRARADAFRTCGLAVEALTAEAPPRPEDTR